MKRSPCLQCERHLRGEDKESTECQNCHKRIAYADGLDPENLTKRQFKFDDELPEGHSRPRRRLLLRRQLIAESSSDSVEQESREP